jgi:hypothetical protein
MNIITLIRKKYLGIKEYPIKRFIPYKEEDIQVEDYITYITPHTITNYSIIEGNKCFMYNFDLNTNEWIFKSLDKTSDVEFRFVDISCLEVLPLNK